MPLHPFLAVAVADGTALDQSPHVPLPQGAAVVYVLIDVTVAVEVAVLKLVTVRVCVVGTSMVEVITLVIVDVVPP